MPYVVHLPAGGWVGRGGGGLGVEMEVEVGECDVAVVYTVLSRQ